MTEGVQKYWEGHAVEFDHIYGERSGALERRFNHLFRKAMFQRLELAVDAVRERPGCSVLDVGCGSGRGTVAFAAAGAKRVVGVDFSAPMVDLARDLARRRGVEERCEFLVADFGQHDFGTQFDLTVALGVLDYVAEPLPFLRRMRELTRGAAIVSVPQPRLLRSTFRRWRYARQGCPVFFTTGPQLEALMRAAGFFGVTIHDHGAGAVGVGAVAPRTGLAARPGR